MAVIGGTADIPHGAACAALLPAVIEANMAALWSTPDGGRALQRYAEPHSS